MGIEPTAFELEVQRAIHCATGAYITVNASQSLHFCCFSFRRWLRLLFLRELEFPPCLILWDAIFAIDRNTFNLADFIFISLLMSLRDRIIFTDNSNCLRLLMQQDLRIDCLNILKKALYLQNPEVVLYLKKF